MVSFPVSYPICTARGGSIDNACIQMVEPIAPCFVRVARRLCFEKVNNRVSSCGRMATELIDHVHMVMVELCNHLESLPPRTLVLA